MNGIFISFEGCDGCGKSTQLRILTTRLRDEGYDFLVTREPGGTEFGETVRNILLDPEGPDRGVLAELFLYAASRSQLVREVVKPALQSGRIVLSERFADSMWVYQGFAGGGSLEDIETVNSMATEGLMPDLTLVFDIEDADVIERRLADKKKDKIESREYAYHLKVREGYRVLAKKYPERIRLIDGSLPIQDVADTVFGEIQKFIIMM